LPAVLLGLAALKLQPDRPAEAPWLSEDEKHALETELAAKAETTRDGGYHTLVDALTKPRVLVLVLLYFCIVVGLYGIGFWMPQVIQTFGLTPLEIGFLTAVPTPMAHSLVGAECGGWPLGGDKSGVAGLVEMIKYHLDRYPDVHAEEIEWTILRHSVRSLLARLPIRKI
jgi:hypothetical protein